MVSMVLAGDERLGNVSDDEEGAWSAYLGQYSPYLYAVLRIVVGFLFVCHGAQKLFGVLGGLGPSGGAHRYFR